MTTIRARLARAGRRLAAAAPDGYSAHWRRRNEQRLRGLEAMAGLIPDSHARPLEAAVDAVAPDLFVAGPAWLPEDAPAFHRWVMQLVEWGADHPCNPPFPSPVPAAYLDLLLAHPDAVCGHTCGGCGIPVPSTRASGEPGVNYR